MSKSVNLIILGMSILLLGCNSIKQCRIYYVPILGCSDVIIKNGKKNTSTYVSSKLASKKETKAILSEINFTLNSPDTNQSRIHTKILIEFVFLNNQIKTFELNEFGNVQYNEKRYTSNSINKLLYPYIPELQILDSAEYYLQKDSTYNQLKNLYH